MNPKILLWDIETSPNEGGAWGKWQQNLLYISKYRELLSVSYKWLGEKKVTCITRQGEKTDQKLSKKIAKLLEQADITIAHNGDSFDRKVVKARLIYWNLPPIKVNSSVDTKEAATRYFSFTGNSLGDLCHFFGFGEKLATPGISLWLGCMANDGASWKKMVEYNKHDVSLLEKVYKRMRPWIENHPNITKLMHEEPNGKCPDCSSKKITRNGHRVTAASLLQRWSCHGCGKHFLTSLRWAK